MIHFLPVSFVMLRKLTKDDVAPLFATKPKYAELTRQLVPHKILTACQSRLLRSIAAPGSCNLVFVVGPSGIGKTLLLHETAALLKTALANKTGDLSALLPEVKTELEQGASNVPASPYMPVVKVVAPTGRTVDSRYKGLLMEILKHTNPALIKVGRMVAVDPDGGDTEHRRRIVTLSGAPIPALEACAREGLMQRKVAALFVDEGQQLPSWLGDDELQRAADGLKLLGSISGTLVVFFGTIELLRLRRLNPQLERRTRAIIFKAYNYFVEEERAAFHNVVSCYVNKMPDVFDADTILSNVPAIHAACIGCVGRLHQLLCDSYAQVLFNKASLVCFDDIKRCFPDVSALERAFAEMEAYERAAVLQRRTFDAFLSHYVSTDPRKPTEHSGFLSKCDTAERGKRRTRRPFERNPTYDSYEPPSKQ